MRYEVESLGRYNASFKTLREAREKAAQLTGHENVTIYRISDGDIVATYAYGMEIWN